MQQPTATLKGKVQVGDFVRFGNYHNGTVTEINHNHIYYRSENGCDGSWSWAGGSTLEIIRSKSKNMNLLEKFQAKLLPEPEKSYRKLGLTGEGGIPTEEGVKIYLAYLMKNDAKFVEDVVKPLLAEQEESEK